MTTKHSPGPWAFQAHGSLILDARPGSSQCAVAHVQVNTYKDEGRHNANLIAAAPDLLHACLAMIEWDAREKDHAIDFYARIKLCELALEKARAAVSRAEGAG